VIRNLPLPSLLLVLGLFFLPPIPVAGVPPGLIDQPQTFPWSVGLTPVFLEEAGGLEPGQSRLRTSVLWFNTYRQAGLDDQMYQRVDMEGLLETVSGVWSPAPGWELRGQAQGWELGGGIMDAFLAGFHGTIGVPNQGRQFVSDNQYRDYLKGEFDLTNPVPGLTQASVGVRGFDGPWSWSSWVKVPVPAQADWGWSDRWGGGTGVGWGDRWPLADLGFQIRAGGTISLVTVGTDDRFAGQTGNFTGQFGLYAAAELFSGPRLVVEGSYTGVPRGGDGYLPQGAGLLTMGGQFPLDPTWTVEVATTEEFLTWATMEVGFQAGVALTL